MRKNLRDLIRDQWGTGTTSRYSAPAATIGAAAQQLMPEDPTRLGFLMVNTSGTTIRILPRNNVSGASGIVLAAGGGSVAVEYKDDYELPGLEWFAIADVAGASYLLMEVLTADG